MKKVITYQAPNGATISLTRAQIAALKKAGRWPRNASGEYCTVSHGLHVGEPTCDPDPDLLGAAPATDSNKNSFAADIAEMMAGWNKIAAAAKAQFPTASKEELYNITKGAMNHALGLKCAAQ